MTPEFLTGLLAERRPGVVVSGVQVLDESSGSANRLRLRLTYESACRRRPPDRTLPQAQSPGLRLSPGDVRQRGAHLPGRRAGARRGDAGDLRPGLRRGPVALHAADDRPALRAGRPGRSRPDTRHPRGDPLAADDARAAARRLLGQPAPRRGPELARPPTGLPEHAVLAGDRAAPDRAAPVPGPPRGDRRPDLLGRGPDLARAGPHAGCRRHRSAHRAPRRRPRRQCLLPRRRPGRPAGLAAGPAGLLGAGRHLPAHLGPGRRPARGARARPAGLLPRRARGPWRGRPHAGRGLGEVPPERPVRGAHVVHHARTACTPTMPSSSTSRGACGQGRSWTPSGPWASDRGGVRGRTAASSTRGRSSAGPGSAGRRTGAGASPGMR